ncbi:MAG: AAA family ATPase [Spirochaetes bacterium]|nr:AAA family ATPase [Spirochaetota bacterium]
MKYRERALSRRLTGLMQRFPIVVVSGARQVGKTTLAVHSFPEWPRVTLDPSIDVGNARADPDLFLRNYRPPLVIDEVQYAPELVSALKRAVDSDRSPGRYLLTGSQQWQVLRSASESLAGRAVFIDLEAFSLHEIAEALGDLTIRQPFRAVRQDLDLPFGQRLRSHGAPPRRVRGSMVRMTRARLTGVSMAGTSETRG